jgi:hypothetical protein
MFRAHIYINKIPETNKYQHVENSIENQTNLIIRNERWLIQDSLERLALVQPIISDFLYDNFDILVWEIQIHVSQTYQPINSHCL